MDYAHTPHAEHNRRLKAQALAEAARSLGVPARDLAAGGGRRRDVARAAGISRAPSEATWALAAETLGPDPVPVSSPRVRGCRYGCAGPARFFLMGWLCVSHAPPPPAPNPGPTLADLLARRAARTPGVAPAPEPERAPATQSLTALYQVAKAAQLAQQRGRRGSGRR